MWLNYNENYAVSDDGYVMNRKKGLILCSYSNEKGYLQVRIHGKMIKVHQIVADRFCPKTSDDLEVDHINQDKTDNRAYNLRWVDKSTNCRNRGNPTNISKNGNRYEVKFKARGKRIYRKYFKTLEEATAAKDAFKNSPEYLSA